MPPAARVSDMHVCPMVTGVVPHVGGPILPPGAPTVLIGGLPAAVVGGMCTCTGPPAHTAMSPTRAAGRQPISTVGQPGGRIGPPTCGMSPVTIGQTCMSVMRAAGGMGHSFSSEVEP